MLAELYEYRAVLFEGAESSFGAAEVAFFELLGVFRVVVALEDVSVAVRSMS
jgi:hypothetical protein